jgi:hypothetical protein
MPGNIIFRQTLYSYSTKLTLQTHGYDKFAMLQTSDKKIIGRWMRVENVQFRSTPRVTT